MEPLKAYDWVRDTRSGMKRPIVQLQPNCIALTNPEEDGKHFIKWVPEPGEWCWFFNIGDAKLDISPHIGKYGNLSYTLDYYDLAEPFIGELPSFLKEG